MTVKVKKFTASSIAACMEQVKAEMGDRAFIVHKREYDRPILFGLLRRRVAEVTAAVDVEQQQRIHDLLELGRRHTGDRDPACPPARVDYHQEAIVPPPLRAVDPSPPDEAEQLPAPQPRRETHHRPTQADAAQASSVQEELAELRRLLSALSSRFQEAAPEVFGEPFDAIHRRLVRCGVERPVAGRIVAELSQRPWPEAPAAQEDALIDALAGYLPASGAIALPAGERETPKVVVLVGPTGMGKTTTLAKIAAEMIAGRGLDVRFITTDTYRMAAMEQLQRYVDIMGSTLTVVYSVQEMADAIGRLRDADLVLIDTAGCSHFNREQLAELKALLLDVPDLEAHLVLAANVRPDDMAAIVERFRELPLSRLLLTKLDETAGYGPVLTLALRAGLPFSYLTTGQNVPEDIEPADSRALAELILGRRRLLPSCPAADEKTGGDGAHAAHDEEPAEPDAPLHAGLRPDREGNG